MQEVGFDIVSDGGEPTPWLLIWLFSLLVVGLVFAARSRFLKGTVWAHGCYFFAGSTLAVLLLWVLAG